MQNRELLLYNIIPNFSDLKEMSLEDLGLKMLQVFHKEKIANFSRYTIQYDNFNERFGSGGYPELSGHIRNYNRDLIEKKIEEAWLWLSNQRYIISQDGTGNLNGNFRLTDMGTT